MVVLRCVRVDCKLILAAVADLQGSVQHCQFSWMNLRQHAAISKFLVLFVCCRVRFALWIVLDRLGVNFGVLFVGKGKFCFEFGLPALAVQRFQVFVQLAAWQQRLSLSSLGSKRFTCSALPFGCWSQALSAGWKASGRSYHSKGPTFQRVFHFKGTTASKELLLKGATTSKEAFGISPQVGWSERELEVSQTTFELPQFFLICGLRVLEY